LRLQAKTRTFGGRKGKTAALKKAVVTLTEGSKQPDVLNI
jgi:ribosomal protein L23